MTHKRFELQESIFRNFTLQKSHGLPTSNLSTDCANLTDADN